MKGKLFLYVDQYGNRYYSKTVKELRSKILGGGSRISKMYRDCKSGKTVHCGYVVGGRWLTAYQPVELPA